MAACMELQAQTPAQVTPGPVPSTPTARGTLDELLALSELRFPLL